MPRRKPTVGSIDSWCPEEDWRPLGACHGMADMFYPDPQDEEAVALACTVCNTQCSVRRDCLEYALAHHDEHGVWGGQSEGERRVLLKQRRSASA